VTIPATTMRPATATVTNFLSAVKTYLSGVKTAVDVTLPGVTLVVWSRLNAATSNVTSIQTGDVLDVQRRRRDQLVEQYSSLAWP
jgi:hypothetical protein